MSCYVRYREAFFYNSIVIIRACAYLKLRNKIYKKLCYYLVLLLSSQLFRRPKPFSVINCCKPHAFDWFIWALETILNINYYLFYLSFFKFHRSTRLTHILLATFFFHKILVPRKNLLSSCFVQCCRGLNMLFKHALTASVVKL